MKIRFSVFILAIFLLNPGKTTYAMEKEPVKHSKKQKFSEMQYDEPSGLVMFTRKKIPTLQEKKCDSFFLIEATYEPSISYIPKALLLPKEEGDFSIPPQLPQKEYRKETLLENIHREKESCLVSMEKHVSETKNWPYSVCAYLKIKFQDSVYTGSAGIVGPQHVLTSAQNVYKNKWADKISIYPALNGNSAPFGKMKVAKIYVFKEWVEKKKENLNIALLVLNQSIGKFTGWYGLLNTKDNIFFQVRTNLTGYFMREEPQKMYTRKMEDNNINDLIIANGSPMWINQWGLPMLAGIHTIDEHQNNVTVKISKEKINNFLTKTIFETYTLNKNDNSPNLLEKKLDAQEKPHNNLNTNGNNNIIFDEKASYTASCNGRNISYLFPRALIAKDSWIDAVFKGENLVKDQKDKISFTVRKENDGNYSILCILEEQESYLVVNGAVSNGNYQSAYFGTQRYLETQNKANYCDKFYLKFHDDETFSVRSTFGAESYLATHTEVGKSSSEKAMFATQQYLNKNKDSAVCVFRRK